MRTFVRICSILLLLMSVQLYCQTTQATKDVLGVHDMSAGTSPIHGDNASACLYCHAPHSGKTKGPLWSHEFSTNTYTQLYASDTLQNEPTQPNSSLRLGSDSNLCLSCHDGTVALGQTKPYGQITMSGALTTDESLTNLQASHPFSLAATPPADAANLVDTLHASGTTSDPTHSVKLIKGNVECTSCHEPHRQAIDQYSQKFLALENRKGAICLSCHTTQARTVKGLNNPLVGWETSVHATTDATYKPSAGINGYISVADSGCGSCHMSHDAGGAKGLLRPSSVSAAEADDASKSCINCHNGGSDKLSVSVLDVYSEFSTKSHPFPTSNNLHNMSEPVVLDNNRHASCVDCHNSHASKIMTSASFNAAPGLRPSQYGVSGVAVDGTVITGPATNQYENCLRCHGNSSGKQKLETTYGYLPTRAVWGGDELNLILQFGSSSTSSHPVMRDATPSAATQPSLLNSMLDFSGAPTTRSLQPGPIRIFCTDCHNNDQNREFGGSKPNGPHGSANGHILERVYTMSKVSEGAAWPNGGPGTQVINPIAFSTPYPATGGDYALCSKCHDLNNVAANNSFPQHNLHVAKGISDGQGFSCSVCHSAHGVPSGSPAGSSGRRLVNFDVRVVAPNGTTTSYNSDGTCSLTCHMVRHYDNAGQQGTEQLTLASPRPF